MAWVSLNDVFVNKAGGSISGNLSVDGSLTINSGKGDGSTYNVATQLTNLNNNKAAASHTHSATDITKGTLSLDHLPTIPVSKGGTGATTASAALTNLGAASAQALKDLQDSVSRHNTPTVLYDNWGTNTTTMLSIKLSDSAANYKYLDFFYGKLDNKKGGYGYTRVYNPNNKRVMFLQMSYAVEDSVLQIVGSKWLINGIAVSSEYNGYINFSIPNLNINGIMPNENRQIIYRVEGYKD